ncbi:unnamed protein product, partial [marine sediment metagenome]
EIKSNLEGHQEIRLVEFVSSDQALKEFLVDNDDSIIKQALDEIGENPLLASLVVQANQPHQYETINAYLENSEFKAQISRINYSKNKTVIESITNALATERREGIIAASIFILIAILITFNTIRLTMFSRKQEFEIMRLVGASNMYVRMPYIFEGIFYGVTAAVVTITLLLITAKYTTLSVMFVEGDVWAFYMKFGWYIFGALLVFGVSMGVISGYIAIRKHLKV